MVQTCANKASEVRGREAGERNRRKFDLWSFSYFTVRVSDLSSIIMWSCACLPPRVQHPSITPRETMIHAYATSPPS